MTLLEPIDTLLEGVQYGATHRPPTFSTVPPGFTFVGEGPRLGSRPQFAHGVVKYDKPLSDRDAQHFSLIRILPEREVALRVADEMREYAEAYLEDLELLEDQVGMILDGMRDVAVAGVSLHDSATVKRIAKLVTKELR